MSWTLLVVLVVVSGLSLFATLSRRAELRRMRAAVAERERAVRQGTAEAQLQHPVIDLTRCLGCATCVAVCPEQGVLEIVHGQAIVVNGARCQGISACERECPSGAITVTLTNLSERDDVPVVSDGLEAIGTPGLFLAGEVTAHALIRTAIDHGALVAREAAQRIADDTSAVDVDVVDLCIVGSGPAGLACSLESVRLGISHVVFEQEAGIGGTVAKYPRRKLVLTQPIDLPIVGRLERTTYEKEELMELWERVATEHGLPIRTGAVLEGIDRHEDGTFTVHTSAGSQRARNVCLALGRRGVPRRLDVPGEGLPKVAYALMDAASYQGRRILVVGGGDSAVETAVALAEQPGNRVTLSYRREAFFRIRSKNEERLRAAVDEGRIRVLFESEVRAIAEDHVELVVKGEDGAPRTGKLSNDEVFVMAGGIPPFELLQRSGVSFDPSMRPAAGLPEEQGSGLVRALAIGFLLCLGALAWALWHFDYYSLPFDERPAHLKHAYLRPGLGIGLGLGIASLALILLNLAYLLRRTPGFPLRFGSLQMWMTSHVATGILAFLCAVLHAAMSPKDTPGGNAFWALLVLLVTGAIGRYFYAYVPRAANGRELELAEVRGRLDGLFGDSALRGFGERARAEVEQMVEARQWRGSFLGRVLALVGVQLDLRRTLRKLEHEGHEQGVGPEELQEALSLARRAHKTALTAAHYEDLRGVLSAWRYLHRWVALLMVVLVVVHVVYALAYGAHFFERGGS